MDPAKGVLVQGMGEWSLGLVLRALSKSQTWSPVISIKDTHTQNSTDFSRSLLAPGTRVPLSLAKGGISRMPAGTQPSPKPQVHPTFPSYLRAFALTFPCLGNFSFPLLPHTCLTLTYSEALYSNCKEASLYTLTNWLKSAVPVHLLPTSLPEGAEHSKVGNQGEFSTVTKMRAE